MANNLNARLLEAAQRAYETTLFYEQLYRNKPESTVDIPFIHPSAFHSAEGVLNCIVDRQLVNGTLPPYARHGQDFPFTVTESECEMELRHKRFIHALDNILQFELRKSKTFLILIDETTGPFCGNFLSSLAWERHRASFLYWVNTQQLHDDLKAFNAECLIIATPLVHQRDIPEHTVVKIQIQHVNYQTTWHQKTNAILVCDECTTLAYKTCTDSKFHYSQDSLLLESNPNSGYVAVTTIDFDCQPFIRYSLNLKASSLAL